MFTYTDPAAAGMVRRAAAVASSEYLEYLWWATAAHEDRETRSGYDWTVRAKAHRRAAEGVTFAVTGQYRRYFVLDRAAFDAALSATTLPKGA